MVEAVPDAVTRMFEAGRVAPEWVGLAEDDARALAGQSGVDRVRVFRTGSNFAGHADGRPGRLNLVVHDGLVVLAAFF